MKRDDLIRDLVNTVAATKIEGKSELDLQQWMLTAMGRVDDVLPDKMFVVRDSETLRTLAVHWDEDAAQAHADGMEGAEVACWAVQ